MLDDAFAAMTSANRRRRALATAYLGALVGVLVGPLVAAVFWFALGSGPGALATLLLGAVCLGVSPVLRRLLG